ncbi:MAG TPA: diacylglycerol kinase family protein [Terriglobia bacterium]|nr:diacylglycerol kinase family protein [Terriglobia bacterium]
MKRRAALIANPKAGQAGSRERTETIDRFLRLMKERGFDVELCLTQGPRDATRLAAQAAREGFRDVIVSGGDGTINEALQGLVGTGARLLAWPRGTANVLGRELRMPRRLETLADVFAAGKVQRAFAACATSETTGERRYFLLMAGIGLDAAIVDRVRPALKKRLGKAAFWYSGWESLTRWKPTPFALEIDGKTRSGTFAALGRTPRYGGNLAITPRARLDRPDFEVCLIDAAERRRYLKLLPFALFGGMPATLKGVSFYDAPVARATGEGVLVQADGELIGSLPMSFAVTSEVIEVVTR